MESLERRMTSPNVLPVENHVDEQDHHFKWFVAVVVHLNFGASRGQGEYEGVGGSSKWGVV